MLPSVTLKNKYASTIEQSIGPQRPQIPKVVETESKAGAKVSETAAKVTLFVMAESELKLNVITVEGQGS